MKWRPAVWKRNMEWNKFRQSSTDGVCFTSRAKRKDKKGGGRQWHKKSKSIQLERQSDADRLLRKIDWLYPCWCLFAVGENEQQGKICCKGGSECRNINRRLFYFRSTLPISSCLVCISALLASVLIPASWCQTADNNGGMAYQSKAR